MGKRRRRESKAESIKPQGISKPSETYDFQISSKMNNMKRIIQNSGFKDKLVNEHFENIKPTITEMEMLDRTMGKISYLLELLLGHCQWLKNMNTKELLDNSSLNNSAHINKYRVAVAASLVQQYWNDDLPILDTILSPRFNIQMGDWSIPSSDLSPQRLDELQAFVIQCAIDSIESLKQRVKGDHAFFEKSQDTIDTLRSKIVGTQPVGPFSRLQHSDIKEVKVNNEESTWPPELPTITDDKLIDQIFTHKSAISDASLTSSQKLLHIHNERLEFKGDSILDFIICDMLYNTFPNDSEGSLSMKKASLVCNDTLFDLSVSYKLHERLKVSSDLHGKIYSSTSGNVPDASIKNKALADVFEAYIAGVAMNRGLIVVQDWLRKLFLPLVNEMKLATTAKDTDKNAKNELYSKIGSADRAITYVTLNSESPFTVSCRIGNEEIGRGTDRTVKLAGLRAAEFALHNTDIIEKYAAERRKIPKTAPNTGF